MKREILAEQDSFIMCSKTVLVIASGTASAEL